VTAFFALRLSGRSASGERRLDVTARLPLEGVPEGRIEAVSADLLSDRDRLLRFILILLSDDIDVDRMLDELEGLVAERRAGTTPSGSTVSGTLGLPQVATPRSAQEGGKRARGAVLVTRPAAEVARTATSRIAGARGPRSRLEAGSIVRGNAGVAAASDEEEQQASGRKRPLARCAALSSAPAPRRIRRRAALTSPTAACPSPLTQYASNG
jgi:hypothetical protein